MQAILELSEHDKVRNDEIQVRVHEMCKVGFSHSQVWAVLSFIDWDIDDVSIMVSDGTLYLCFTNISGCPQKVPLTG